MLHVIDGEKIYNLYKIPFEFNMFD